MNTQEKPQDIQSALERAIMESDGLPSLTEKAAGVLARLKEAGLVIEQNWQDISEAPKEGELVRIWSQGKTPITAYFSQVGLGWRSVPGDKRYKPTHFKHLPAIPEKDSP